MNKREYLKQLIDNSQDSTQVKMNKIVNTLQLTEDILKAKPLSQKVITGELDSIRDEAIDNLIGAFGGNLNDIISVKVESTIPVKVENNINTSKEQELLMRLEELKMQIEQDKMKINELTKENTTLRELTQLTTNFGLIEVSDSDINELYIRYMKDGTTSHGDAFIVDRIIPKSYYKL